MGKILIKNADAVITCDHQDRILKGCDILIDDNKIAKIAPGIECPDAEVIDGKGKFVYPGLINTHHHLLQAFTRNIPLIQEYELFDWLLYLYKVWERVRPDYMYLSAMVDMAEFVKFGGTTLFDQHFAFPRSSGREIIDSEFRAAEEIGLRFHAGRSCFTRGKEDGGLPPMELIETTQETLDDCTRLIEKYHDPNPFSMRQVVVAPCSPFSVTTDVMVESAKLARDKNVRLHTHLCETRDEERYCLEVYGDRPLDWAEKCGWMGSDVWYAHGIHFTDDEVRRLAETKTGVSHNPVSNMKLASGICKVPLMLELGVPVGLAVDGNGSNDDSNLLADIRVCYLLHRLNASKEMSFAIDGEPGHELTDKARLHAPSGYDCLKLATVGSAELLGRTDIGRLEEGMAADLFMLDVNQLDYVGGLLDPAAFLGTIGYSRPVWMTMVNGKIVWKDNKLTGIDEEKMRVEAAARVAKVYENLPTE
ncbi:MAG: amidohydrolase family protein [Lachnospiraceae bacterium]|nr:amidohydrolase family protein [Lachnospiraceae bacterium]